MIIVGKSSPSSTRPDHLTTEFNCVAMESTVVDLFYDDAFVYLLPDETLTLDIPADWNLQTGQEVPLSRLAAQERGQTMQTHLVWTFEELPQPANYRP